MKVAVVATGDDSGLGASFVRAARRLGHHANLLAVDELVSGRRRTVLARRLHVESVITDPLLRRLRNAVIESEPTIILVVKGRFIPRRWVEELRASLGRPVLNYYPDHPFWPGYSDSQILESLRGYDEVLIWAEDVADALVERGLEQVRVIPFGYDPALYRSPSTALTPRWDASLIGQFYPERLPFVLAVGDRKVRISGRGWRRGAAGTSVANRVSDRTYGGAEICRIYWESIAAFNLVAPWNARSHNMRTFEIPASRTVMIATRTPQHEALYGEEGAVLVDTPGEARSALLALAEDPERRESIAWEGHRRIAQHTYVERMASLLAAWNDCGDKHRRT